MSQKSHPCNFWLYSFAYVKTDYFVHPCMPANAEFKEKTKENKKFQISKVASGAKFKDYWGCIEWLVDAGMVNLCYCLHTLVKTLFSRCRMVE